MKIIVTNGEMPPEEQRYYAQYVTSKYPRLSIEKIFLTVADDHVEIAVEPKRTLLTKMGGALIGDPFRWNDAKRAEYFDTIPNPIEP